MVCKRLDDRGREAALRTRRTAFHKESDGAELNGFDDTRLRIIDVGDVRHKSIPLRPGHKESCISYI